MATINGRLTIQVLSAAPPAGTPFLVFTPPVPQIEPGKSLTVTIRVNDGSGGLSVPAGVLVPFWTGTNGGIQVTVLAADSLKIDVPAACPNGSYILDMQLR